MDPFLGPIEETWPFLFLRLHGKLFARVELDSFDDDYDTLWSVFYNEEPFSRTYWSRIAIISITSLYQYARKDSRLKDALRHGRREKREAEEEPPLPTEDNPLDGAETEMANVDRAPKAFTNIPVANISPDKEDNLSRIVFDKSALLAFSLLSEALQSCEPLAGGFVNIWLVFLTYALRYPSVVRLLERHVPWEELAVFLSGTLDWLGEEGTLNVIEELNGPVLAEDRMMRGFEWSRKVFPRGWFDGGEFEEDEGEVGVEREELVAEVAARNNRILSLGLQICKVRPLSLKCC